VCGFFVEKVNYSKKEAQAQVNENEKCFRTKHSFKKKFINLKPI